jgi:hypothetical protein
MIRPALIRSLTVLVAVGLAAASASAVTVLRNTKTGETIRGELTNQRVNKLVVFKEEGGGTRFLDPAEWTAVSEAAPAPAAGAAPGPAAPAPADVARVHIVPIQGPILSYALVDGVERALREARTRRAGVVVFRMDTPGGRLDLGDEIIQMIGKVDWATTAAWVQGGEKRALSLGAYLCLATHHIYMDRGTTIGAATPFRVTFTGSAAVDEKMTSAVRARFRSLAQERGHPDAVAEAMVDARSSVVQVFVDGQQRLVTEADARQLEKDCAGSDRFKRGKTLAAPGRLLTLTSQEAVEFGVAKGLASDEKELMQQMGLARYQIAESAWLPDWVEKEAKKAKDAVAKYTAAFDQYMEQVNLNDPRRQQYLVKDENMTFADGGRRWREYTDKCLASLKQCAAALVELEKLSKDKRADFNVPEEILARMKSDMQSRYSRLQAQRGAIRMP